LTVRSTHGLGVAVSYTNCNKIPPGRGELGYS
jgi:hypothetical protein